MNSLKNSINKDNNNNGRKVNMQAKIKYLKMSLNPKKAIRNC